MLSRLLKLAALLCAMFITVFGLVQIAQAAVIPSQNALILPPFGGFLVATSTDGSSKVTATSTPFFSNFFSTLGHIVNASTTITSAATLCLSTDCRTAWPSGGSGTVATSSSETANYIPKWTSTNGTPALLSGTSLIYDSGTGVGIGTTSPFANLSVLGGTNGTAFYAKSATTSEPAAIQLNDYGFSIGSHPSSNPDDFFHIENNQNQNTSVLIKNLTNGANSQTVIHMYSDAANWRLATYSTVAGGLINEVAQSNASWNFLEVAAVPITWYTNNVQRMELDGSGRLGIGSTTPGSLFSIGGSGTGTNFYDSATTTKSGAGGYNITGGGCYAVGGTCISGGSASLTGTQGQVAYFSGTNAAAGTSTIFITPAGGVGIGLTNPGSALEAKGTTTDSTGNAFIAWNSANTNLFDVRDDGNVGINTATPAQKLDVAGYINTDQYSGYKQDGLTVLYATSTASNTSRSAAVAASAAAAWMAATSTNFYDVAIGLRALQTTPVNANAAFNTAIGWTALGADTTGGSNAAIGFGALAANTAGSDNFALGVNSLNANLTGVQNVAIGTNALNKSLSNNNLAIGYNSLTADTTGSGNVGVGTQALLNNATGANNVAIGFDAAFRNLSATSTVAIGGLAGFGNGGTYFNQGGTYVGFQSGFSLTTDSDYNTFLGHQSGYLNTSGFENILIGVQKNTSGAGYLTTGGDNVGIGYNLRFPSATANNQYNLGNFVFGTLPATSTASTYLLPTTGNFGISTTTTSLFGINANNGATYTNLFSIGSSTASATTTLFNVNNVGTVQISTLGTAAGTFLAADPSGNIIATTTPSGGSGTVTSIATNNGITGGTITTTGTIGLAAIAANSVLGNVTGASGVPSAVATSSLFTGTTGQGAYFASTGGLVGTSTLFITAGATVGVGTTTTVYGANSFTQAISNGVTALGGLLINTVTNVTNAFSIFNAAGANVFNVDTTASNPFLGVGTSTPYSTISAVGNATNPIFALASTTNSGLPNFSVDKNGLVVTSGVKPVVSSCGSTNNISGNDMAGSIMFTGTLVTTCTITFATPVPTGQTLGCTVSDNSLTGFADVSATSTTAVTFGISTGLASGSLFYSCNRWQ